MKKHKINTQLYTYYKKKNRKTMIKALTINIAHAIVCHKQINKDSTNYYLCIVYKFSSTNK